MSVLGGGVFDFLDRDLSVSVGVGPSLGIRATASRMSWLGIDLKGTLRGDDDRAREDSDLAGEAVREAPGVLIRGGVLKPSCGGKVLISL